MNLIQPFPTASISQPEVVLANSDDVAMAAYAQGLLDAATTDKTTAQGQLEAACAKAVRERHYKGGASGEADRSIRELVATITKLEGQIAFYTAAITGLS